MSLMYASNLKDVINILELGYMPAGKSLLFVERNGRVKYNEGAVIWLKPECVVNKPFKLNGEIIKCNDAVKKLDTAQLNEITTGKINNKFIRKIFVVSNDKKLVKKIIDITNDMELTLTFLGIKT